jgi:hypothetical protein
MTTHNPISFLLATGGLLVASGCDRFFEVQGTVSDCATNAPIAAATVVAQVDPSYADESKSYETTTEGRYLVHLNKPPSAPVTITFSKTGFAEVARHFDGIPTTPYIADVCLQSR